MTNRYTTKVAALCDKNTSGKLPGEELAPNTDKNKKTPPNPASNKFIKKAGMLGNVISAGKAAIGGNGAMAKSLAGAAVNTAKGIAATRPLATAAVGAVGAAGAGLAAKKVFGGNKTPQQ